MTSRDHRLRPLFVCLASLIASASIAQEICDNGIDDDGDGLVDLNDPDCVCSAVILAEGVGSYIPNHSFEDITCCPLTFSFGNYNPLGCAVDWYQATLATSDFFHECGFFPATLPLPPPDGVACVGFIATHDYKEYIGSCFGSNVLQAGVEYTLSLHIAGFSLSNVGIAPTGIFNNGVYYEGALPFTLFGLPTCVPFPLPNQGGCVGDLGWTTLGSVQYEPNGGWDHISMTFTPPTDIATLIIGPGCDTPESFFSAPGPPNDIIFHPYFIIDDLMLTLAGDQVTMPVQGVGDLCAGDVVLMGSPPPGATGLQWYLDGVAIVGQTTSVLNVSVLGMGAGTYTLTTSVDGQCLMGSTTVSAPVVPDAAFTLGPSSGCAPLTVTFSDQSGAMSATWSFGDGGTASGSETTHTYALPGVYDVTLFITTSAGCTVDSTLVAAVTVFAGPAGMISATPNPTDVQNTSVFLSGAGSTGTILSWWWDLGEVPPYESMDGSLLVDLPPIPGDYPVMLVVQDQNGCVDTVLAVVTVLPIGDIDLPNVFSPNGDGSNDRFVPMHAMGVQGRMDIYNRWGQLLFSTDALAHGWDGRAAGQQVPAGTYYYVVTPQGSAGVPLTGHITLLR